MGLHELLSSTLSSAENQRREERFAAVSVACFIKFRCMNTETMHSKTPQVLHKSK